MRKSQRNRLMIASFAGALSLASLGGLAYTFLAGKSATKCVMLRVKGDQVHQSEFYVDEADPRWLVIVNPIEVKCMDKLPDTPAPEMPSFHPQKGPRV